MIGTDPEFFLVDKSRKPYRNVPAHYFFAGTKDSPMKVTDGIHLLTDNVMLEANVDPVDTKQGLVDVVNNLKEVITDLLPPGLHLDITPEASFEEVDKDEKFYEFGCDPDWNVWTDEESIPPDLSSVDKRFAGGHIHVSFPNPTPDRQKSFVKILDYILYPEIAKYCNSDRDNYYGGLGNFRYKDYGIEYRSLSNFWLSHDYFIGIVFDKIQEGLEILDKDIEITKEDIENVKEKQLSVL